MHKIPPLVTAADLSPAPAEPGRTSLLPGAKEIRTRGSSRAKFCEIWDVVRAVPCAGELRVCRRRDEAADLSREQPGEFDRRQVLALGTDDLQAHR